MQNQSYIIYFTIFFNIFKDYSNTKYDFSVIIFVTTTTSLYINFKNAYFYLLLMVINNDSTK